jgi:predicted transcriptional regulator
MSSAKEAVRQLLDQLPDDVSIEDIQYHLYLRQKIERGLADAEAGRVVSHEEIEKQTMRW